MAYGVYAPNRSGEEFLLACPIQTDEPAAWALADKRRGARVVQGTKETIAAKLTREEVERRALRVRSYEAEDVPNMRERTD